MSSWIKVCNINDITPGSGVCAQIQEEQVAIFRPRANSEVFAISNIDPYGHASVLSRGILCEHNEELWVASPLKKQRFNLKTGVCLENEDYNIKAYQIRVNDETIEVLSE